MFNALVGLKYQIYLIVILMFNWLFICENWIFTCMRCSFGGKPTCKVKHQHCLGFGRFLRSAANSFISLKPLNQWPKTTCGKLRHIPPLPTGYNNHENSEPCCNQSMEPQSKAQFKTSSSLRRVKKNQMNRIKNVICAFGGKCSVNSSDTSFHNAKHLSLSLCAHTLGQLSSSHDFECDTV